MIVIHSNVNKKAYMVQLLEHISPAFHPSVSLILRLAPLTPLRRLIPPFLLGPLAFGLAAVDRRRFVLGGRIHRVQN